MLQDSELYRNDCEGVYTSDTGSAATGSDGTSNKTKDATILVRTEIGDL